MADRKVYVRLQVDAILRVEDALGVEQFLEDSTLTIDHPFLGLIGDVEQLDIVGHEVTDSK